MRAICNGPIRQSGEEWWESTSVLRCTVQDWSLSSRMSFPPPPPPLSPSTSLAAARPQSTVKWLLWWLHRIWKQKKKPCSPDLYSSFSLSPFLFPLAMWCWLPRIGPMSLTLREIKLLKQPMSLTLREIKLLKQRRKNRDRHAVLILSESWLQLLCACMQLWICGICQDSKNACCSRVYFYSICLSIQVKRYKNSDYSHDVCTNYGHSCY